MPPPDPGKGAALAVPVWGSRRPAPAALVVAVASVTAAVPAPRRPRCLRHHVWMASCPDCLEEHQPTPTPTEKASKA